MGPASESQQHSFRFQRHDATPLRSPRTCSWIWMTWMGLGCSSWSCTSIHNLHQMCNQRFCAEGCIRLKADISESESRMLVSCVVCACQCVRVRVCVCVCVCVRMLNMASARGCERSVCLGGGVVRVCSDCVCVCPGVFPRVCASVRAQVCTLSHRGAT